MKCILVLYPNPAGSERQPKQVTGEKLTRPGDLNVRIRSDYLAVQTTPHFGLHINFLSPVCLNTSIKLPVGRISTPNSQRCPPPPVTAAAVFGTSCCIFPPFSQVMHTFFSLKLLSTVGMKIVDNSCENSCVIKLHSHAHVQLHAFSWWHGGRRAMFGFH